MIRPFSLLEVGDQVVKVPLNRQGGTSPQESNALGVNIPETSAAPGSFLVPLVYSTKCIVFPLRSQDGAEERSHLQSSEPFEPRADTSLGRKASVLCETVQCFFLVLNKYSKKFLSGYCPSKVW